ncbi:hypothetical protein B0J14DRAFT_152312 [Halenospora varia]|nr:hypothetical protein B0J14DRAFT_152312 [Halenospora varia]
MWKSTVAPEQLQQSISSLQRLNEVPEPPKEHVLALDVGSTHHLGIERECEIASNLAFLSATSDDSKRVMAVCIEEHPNGNGITIRIASNSGDFSEVIKGFRMLATILEKAAQRENLRSEDLKPLLRQIVALDRQRILSRLRSRHSKSRKAVGKQALITQLNQVIHDESVQTRSGLSMSQLMAVRDGARALQVLFTRLETILDRDADDSEVLQVLGNIVKEAHELTRINDLSTALQNFSGDPTLKRHLPEAIGKLARYYSAASELVCAARDKGCRVFQNIEVEPFQIHKPAVAQSPSGKVHAEIQLLFYYELHPDRPRPRIIASSKSACYLCNLFFSLHGGFHVPRTHGRIYEKWILPDWLEVPVERHRDLGIIVTRLKGTLDDERRKTSTSTKKYSHPNESVLLPLAHWPSSSALSRNRLSTASTSTSTIIPPTKEEKVQSQLTLRTDLPLTPPTTPPNPVRNTKISYAGGKDILVPDTVSLMTIQSSDLPYNQAITATTPSLHVQLDKLSLTLEFAQVFSGQVSITQAEDAVKRERYQIVDIGDIPTAKEMQLSCLDKSNELTIQLKNGKKGLVCFNFVWNS